MAERVVRASDEEAAQAKIDTELAGPFGFLGLWSDEKLTAEIVGVERAEFQATDVDREGPLLLSVKDAATALGTSQGSLRELMRTGEIEHVRVGKRVYVSRSALHKFVEANSRPGYHEP